MGAGAHPEPALLEPARRDRGDPRATSTSGTSGHDVRGAPRARHAHLPQPVRTMGHAEPPILGPLRGGVGVVGQALLALAARRPGGAWMEEYQRDYGIAIGNGLRGTLRGLQSLSRFTRRRRDAAVRPHASVPEIDRPAGHLLDSGGESMLTFVDSMALLARAGIEVAPYEVVLPEDASPTTARSGPLVVKLADVAHRTEHDAVLLGAPAAGSRRPSRTSATSRRARACRRRSSSSRSCAGTARSSSGSPATPSGPRGRVRAGGRLRRGAPTRAAGGSRRSARTTPPR